MTYLKKASIFAAALTMTTLVRAETYYDYAKVTGVKTVYDYLATSQPEQHCYPVRYRSRRDHATPTIVGAIVGGAIGHALGENSGSTIAGAIVGGTLAHDASHYRHHSYIVQHCEPVYSNTRKVRKIKGYKVRYRYRGQTYRTFMRRAPGDRIKVRVKVTPAYYD